MTRQPGIDPPRQGSKTESLVRMLRGRGASLETIMARTGWAAHSVRAALTRLRKRGYGVVRRIEAGVAFWSIGDAQ